ncbi:EAL domain-containing protein [Rhizobium sp. L1K21]|uniref:sensor domain-containing protein n=1 Tax=Rhizobium sp. L1K21 TaxID=2954933 RepID=UPI002093F471|nr:EAL domain-containing protein [Rhizobium sp. L1K21]MCO6188134.1 EAL domain-containing protein [Rhizobium sp. L1K21]
MKGCSRPVSDYYTIIGQDRSTPGDGLFAADIADLVQQLPSIQRVGFYRKLMASARLCEPVEFHFDLAHGHAAHPQSLTAFLQPTTAENGDIVWHGAISTTGTQSAYQNVFAASPNKIAIFDSSARFVLVNPNLEAFLGLGQRQVKGRCAGEIFKGQQAKFLDQAIQNVALSGNETFVEIAIENADGVASVQIFKLFSCPDEATGRCRVIAYGHAADDLVKLKAAAEHSQDQLHAAIRTLPDLFWIKDMDGRYTLCNDVFDAFNRVPKGAMLGKTAYETANPINLKDHLETDRRALETNEPVSFEIELPAEDNDPAKASHYFVQKIAIRNNLGEVTGILGTARDVSESKRLEAEIRQREAEYRQLLDNLPDCIVRHSAKDGAIYLNAAMRETIEKTIGYPLDIYLQTMAANPQAHITMAVPMETALEAIRTRKPVVRELEFPGKSGEVFTHELRYFPEFSSDGSVHSALGIGRDITGEKAAERMLQAKERELERIAYTDALTGLANRVRLQETLRTFLNDAIANYGQMALLTLDIDRFKSINDTLGHIVGDELLIEFASRLKKVIATKGWLGRLGGDEFVIILPHVKNRADVHEVAQDIIAAINKPMRIGGNIVSVSTSIGVAIGPEDSACEETLFRFSDIALYQAKSEGRNRACCYSPLMSKRAETHFKLEGLIREGLLNDQFEAFFQAKIALSSRRITGAEALCRWYHPELGFIAPDQFIPVAEDTGQIIEIGKRILRKACEFAVACNRISTRPFTVAVNLSPRQIVFGGFLGVLGQCLEETGCKAEWLELEITESLLLADNESIRETLAAIAGLGILISIDDFGTGYSALSYLRNLPIGGLKVDQSFVRDMNTDEKQAVLVRSVLGMAQGLKLKTVAEGVENEEIARKLETLGCETGQGYLWHKPAPATDLLARLKAQTAAETPAPLSVPTAV